MLEPYVKPGVTLKELDRRAEEFIRSKGAKPAYLGYGPRHNPFPGTICASVNEVICHGIPGPQELKDGDIINIDVTVIKDGWHGDTSRMFVVGEGSIAAKRLCTLTYDAMWHGIAKVNVDTDLRLASTVGIREALNTNPKEFDPRKVFGKAREVMATIVEHKMGVLGSVGKA